ncbi:MAG: M28 family peptidase [Candidatus Eisenbacteria bacterium]|nr:M28 family peptidase [Candidatus Eisenbacteria bacterium]
MSSVRAFRPVARPWQFLLFLTFALAPCGGREARAADEGLLLGTAPAGLGSTRITATRLMSQVDWLCGPRFGGRATGTASCDSLARLLGARLRNAGWKPAVADSSFFDFYPSAGNVRVEGAIGLRDEDRGYRFGRDFTPLAISADGNALAELAFVGYGVSAPERGYDDYAGLEVKGRVVFAFLGAPGLSRGKGLLGAGPVPYGDLFRKAETALLHGAAGLIVAPPPSATQARPTAWKLPAGLAALDAGLPTVMVSPAAAKDLMTGLDLGELQRAIDGTLTPRSRLLGGRRAELLTALHRENDVHRSLLAMLPARSGSDAGALLLIANLNGGGWGPDGAAPTLHPGANSEAAAAAALLEMAEVLPLVPRSRKIYLALVTGADIGGAGARSLARKLTDVTTVISLHALGHGGKTRVECADEQLLARLRSANAELPTPVEIDVGYTVSSWQEAVPFLVRGLSVITISGPTAATDGTPLDTPALIDRDGYLARARFAFAAAQAIAR